MLKIVIGISDCLSGCEQTDDTVLLAHAKKSNATFSTNDKVYVDGGLFAEGSSLNAGCHGQAASSIKVCGCGVKVVAHMLPECHAYAQFDAQIGRCDCGTPDCDEKPFNYRASSFEISAC